MGGSMQAICKLCHQLIVGPQAAVELNISGAAPGGVAGGPALTPDEVRQIVEWHKLGEAMFQHVLRYHPDAAAEPLQSVTAYTGYVFGEFFEGGENFTRMREAARLSALGRLTPERSEGDTPRD